MDMIVFVYGLAFLFMIMVFLKIGPALRVL